MLGRSIPNIYAFSWGWFLAVDLGNSLSHPNDQRLVGSVCWGLQHVPIHHTTYIPDYSSIWVTCDDMWWCVIPDRRRDCRLGTWHGITGNWVRRWNIVGPGFSLGTSRDWWVMQYEKIWHMISMSKYVHGHTVIPSGNWTELLNMAQSKFREFSHENPWSMVDLSIYVNVYQRV